MNLFDVFDDIDEFFNGDCLLLDNPTEYKLVKDCENEYLKLTDDNYDDVELLQFWNNDDTVNPRKTCEDTESIDTSSRISTASESEDDTNTKNGKYHIQILHFKSKCLFPQFLILVSFYSYTQTPNTLTTKLSHHHQTQTNPTLFLVEKRFQPNQEHLPENVYLQTLSNNHHSKNLTLTKTPKCTMMWN